MNLVFRCMPQDKPGQPHDYAAERKRNDRKPPRPPKGVTVRLGELDGLPAEFIQKNGNQKGTIFYIHGGGFTVGSARERRAICQYITANYGYNCVTFNYRLAPENLWPAPLEDCLTAYTGLLKTGVSPKEIVFMGESAGGTLVLSLALLLKEDASFILSCLNNKRTPNQEGDSFCCHPLDCYLFFPRFGFLSDIYNLELV